MSLISDIKTLQDERNNLAEQMRQHRDLLDESMNSEETSEWQSKWDALSEAYDEKKAKQESLENNLARANKIDEKMGQITEDLNTVLSPEKRFTRESLEFVANDWLTNQAMAFAGWVWNADKKAKELITPEIREAARQVNANIEYLNAFDLKLSPTEGFIEARNRWYHDQINKNRNPYNIGQVGKGSTGGFTVGQTLLNRLEEAMLDDSLR